MKLIIFFLYSLNTFAECPRDFFPDISQIEKISPKVCTDLEYFEETEEEKKEICDCAKKNLEIFPADPVDKSELALKIVENSKIPLLSFTEDLMVLKESISDYDMGSCNIKDKLLADNGIFNCKNENPVLDINKRKELAKTIYHQFYNEIKLKSDPSYIPNPRIPVSPPYGVYIRSENSCNISNSDIIQALKHERSASLDQLTKTLLENTDASKVKNFMELYDIFSMQTDNKIMLQKTFDLISTDPYLQNLLASDEYFKAYLAGNSEKYKKSQGKIDLKNQVSSRCESIFSEMNKALCVGDDEVLVSNKNFNKTYSPLQRNASAESALKDSSFIFSQLCSENKSSYDELYDNIQENTSKNFSSIGTFKQVAEEYYNRNYPSKENLICEASKKGIEAETAKECAANPIGYACKLLTAFKKKFSTNKQELAEKKAYNQLKLAGKENDEDIDQKVQVLASELINKISDQEVKDHIASKKEVSNSKIVSTFLGEKTTPEAQNVASSESTSLKQRNLPRANTTRKASSKTVTAKKSPVRSAEKTYDQEMNDFYSNLADKMVQAKKTAESLPPNSSQRKQIEDSIASSYSLNPSKPTSVGNNFSAPSTPSYSSTQSASTSGSSSVSGGNFASSSARTPASEEVATESAQEKINREINDHLNETNNQRQIASAKASGVIGDSPFSDSIGKKMLSDRLQGADKSFYMNEPEIPVNPTSFLEDLKTLTENVLAEKKQGIDRGENAKHAEVILKLHLAEKNAKQVKLTDPNNTNIYVDIVRENGALKLMPPKTAEIQNSPFYKYVNDMIIEYGSTRYKKKFDSLLEELYTAVNKGIRVEDIKEGVVRYGNFQ